MSQLHFPLQGAEYGIGLPASAVINDEGKFVAETPGVFTVIAESGGFSARKTVKVVARNGVELSKLAMAPFLMYAPPTLHGQELVSIRKRFCRNWNLERKRRSFIFGM